MNFNVNIEFYVPECKLEWMAWQIKENGWTVEEAIECAYENDLFDGFLAEHAYGQIKEELEKNYL